MGRATHEKSEQIQYLKSRLKLIADMASSLSDESESSDLENLKQQLDAVLIKVERFKKDWVDHEGR